MSRFARSAFLVFIVTYAVLSVFCTLVTRIAVLKTLFETMALFLWVLGPPLLLIYEGHYLWLYLLETAMITTVAYRGFRLVGKDDPALLIWSLVGLCGWLAGGASAYVIALKAY